MMAIDKKISKAATKNKESKTIKKCAMQHEVMWLDNSDDKGRCAALLYLITRQHPHVIVLLPDVECVGLVKALLRWAGVSCGVATDKDILPHFRNSKVAVLLITEGMPITNQCFGPLKMMVEYRVKGSVYGRRLALVRRATSPAATVTCVSLASREESKELRTMLKIVSPSPFQQKIIEDGVLRELREQIAAADLAPEEEEEEKSAPVPVKPVQPCDKFFSDIEKGLHIKSMASEKTKRKRERKKQLKAAQRSEEKLSDCESADDESSEDEAPRGKRTKKSGGRAGAGKPSYTADLTDVSAAGLKKQRSSLTYEERKAYKQKTQGKRK